MSFSSCIYILGQGCTILKESFNNKDKPWEETALYTGVYKHIIILSFRPFCSRVDEVYNQNTEKVEEMDVENDFFLDKKYLVKSVVFPMLLKKVVHSLYLQVLSVLKCIQQY